MTTLSFSGRTPARRRWSSTTMRTPAPCCCISCGSSTSSSRVTWSRAAHACAGAHTRTISSRASGSATSSGRGVTAPTAPISNSRESTRSITAWVSSTCSEMATPGKSPLEAREHAGQHVLAGTGRCADHDAAGDELAEVEDLGAGTLVEVEDLAAVAVEHLAGVGGDDGAARAVEQGRLELALQAADLLARGRLGDVHLVGGEREALAVDDAAEQAYLADVHKRSLSREVVGGQSHAARCPGRDPRPACRHAPARARSARRGCLARMSRLAGSGLAARSATLPAVPPDVPPECRQSAGGAAGGTRSSGSLPGAASLRPVRPEAARVVRGVLTRRPRRARRERRRASSSSRSAKSHGSRGRGRSGTRVLLAQQDVVGSRGAGETSVGEQRCFDGAGRGRERVGRRAERGGLAEHRATEPDDEVGGGHQADAVDRAVGHDHAGQVQREEAPPLVLVPGDDDQREVPPPGESAQESGEPGSAAGTASPAGLASSAGPASPAGGDSAERDASPAGETRRTTAACAALQAARRRRCAGAPRRGGSGPPGRAARRRGSTPP